MPEPIHPSSPAPPIPALIWHGKFGQLHDLLCSYAGEEADDEPGKPSRALTAYLRTMARTDSHAPAIAARQAREVVHDGDLDSDTFIAIQYIMPRPVTTDEHTFFNWHRVVAALCDAAVETGLPKSVAVPETAWEWRETFPGLFQLLACYLGQDFEGDTGDVDAAIEEWLSTAEPRSTAFVAGEVYHLLALSLDRGELDDCLATLGLAAALPWPAPNWLSGLGMRLFQQF